MRLEQLAAHDPPIANPVCCTAPKKKSAALADRYEKDLHLSYAATFGADWTLRSVVSVFGSRNPVAISQTKPGNLVSGMRKRVFGKTRFSQLSSPQTASKRPNTTSHFGKSFMNAEGIDTPAIKRPSGTEKPGPPKTY